jgi:hypothetical protein
MVRALLASQDAVRFLVGIILIHSCFGCQTANPKNDSSNVHRRQTPEELAQLIHSLKPLSARKSFDGSDWARFAETARIFQRCGRREAVEVFGNFDAKYRLPNTYAPISAKFIFDWDEDSKLQLLFDVVFNLPDHPDGHTMRGGSPIRWNNGRPLLYSDVVEYDGFIYPAAEVYRGISKQYHKRDLRTFKQ